MQRPGKRVVITAYLIFVTIILVGCSNKEASKSVSPIDIKFDGVSSFNCVGGTVYAGVRISNNSPSEITDADLQEWGIQATLYNENGFGKISSDGILIENNRIAPNTTGLRAIAFSGIYSGAADLVFNRLDLKANNSLLFEQSVSLKKSLCG